MKTECRISLATGDEINNPGEKGACQGLYSLCDLI